MEIYICTYVFTDYKCLLLIEILYISYKKPLSIIIFQRTCLLAFFPYASKLCIC